MSRQGNQGLSLTAGRRAGGGVGSRMAVAFAIATLLVAGVAGRGVLTNAAAREHGAGAPDAVQAVNVRAAIDGIADSDPRVQAIAAVGDTVVRVAAVDGTRAWHTHESEDEFVFAIDGELAVEMRDFAGKTQVLALSEGRAVTVPAGTTHRLVAGRPARIMSFLGSSAVSAIDGVE